MKPVDYYIKDGRFNLKTPLKDLLADGGASVAFQHHFPGFSPYPFIMSISLVQIAIFALGLFPADKLNVLAHDLALLDKKIE